MPKVQKRNPLQITYDSQGFAKNAAVGLREHIEIMLKSAPGLTKQIGITPRDILEIRRIEVKLAKLRDYIYDHQGVY